MIDIVYEDNYLIAVNKPAGLQSEKDRWGNPSVEAAVIDYFQMNYPWKKQLIAGRVHRLDRFVSGLLLFAKTPAALKSMLSQFEKRTIRKYYLALVEHTPPGNQGQLTHWLRKDDKNKRSEVVPEKSPGGQLCSLCYRLLQQKNGFSLLEVELLTGRYHQIRAQLSAVDCPVAGDEKYGARKYAVEGTIGLHAHRLALEHPKTGEILELIAPLPGKAPWIGWFL